VGKISRNYLIGTLHRIRKYDFLVALLCLWEVFSRWVYPTFEPHALLFLPPVSYIVKEGWILLKSGILINHAWASFVRICVGFSIAATSGILLGFILGLSQIAYRQLHALCQIFKPIPPVAWIPISLLWFGISEGQQYYIIFIGAFFPILIHTLEAVHTIPGQYKQLSHTLGVRGFLLLRKVLIPAVLPQVFFGIRAGFGYSWFIIVAAEFVSAPNGLGYLILEGRNALITERIFIGMIAIGVINLGFYYILTKLENLVSPWQKLSFES